MRLGDLLHRDVVQVGLKSNTKYEVIEELIDVLVDAHEIPLSFRDHALDIVLERESHHSTGMEHGVALPHGYTDQVDDVIAAIGICKQGIPFESLDGIAARIIVLLLLPRRTFHDNPHTMAGVAHLLANRDLRERLKKAENPAAVMQSIEEEEARETFFNIRARV
jgi:mannitol/fructose-specific phosphotransferase system IIA component (Ntr-type)